MVTIAVALVLVNVPVTSKSVPVPLAIVNVPPVKLTVPPASTSTSSIVKDADIVTLCPLLISTPSLLADVGVAVAALHVAPASILFSQVVSVVQLPVAIERYIGLGGATCTTNELLVPAVKVIPDVRVAVSVYVPAVDNITPDITTLFVPLVMVPVVVPLILPGPEATDNVTLVLDVTLVATALELSDSTVTLNATVACGDAGLIVVTASWLATVTMKELLVPAVSVIPEVLVAVRVYVPAALSVTPDITILFVPLAIVPVVVPPIVPGPEATVKVTAVADVTLVATLLGSCDSTVTLNADVATGDAGLMVVTPSLVAATVTTKLLLVPAVRLIPDVRVAVSVYVPAADNVTPAITTLFVPLVIVPVVVPPIVPGPDATDKVTLVLADTFVATLLELCDSTVTLKPVATNGEAGAIVVTANFVAVIGPNAFKIPVVPAV